MLEKTDNKRGIDKDLDRLEANIKELKILYEQYFIDLAPRPPEQEHQALKRLVRNMLNAPFKNSANRFRLRTLVSRFQSYETYWERVMKQRSEGSYSKDRFKAKIRSGQKRTSTQSNKLTGLSDTGMNRLFESYQSALLKAGKSQDNTNFESFKKTMVEKAQKLKQKGVTKVHYKVVVKGGRVVVKASGKD